MHVSLSEVEAAVAKAAMAVGLPPGLGEDAGRAARLMLRTGLGALSDLVDALDAVDGGASVGFDADRVSAGMLVPANGARQLSALWAGPTACDLLLVAAGPAGGGGRDAGSRNVVALAAVDYPTVVLHQVLDVSRGIGVPLLVAWAAPGTAGPVGRRASAGETPRPRSNVGAPPPAAWPDGGGARVEVVCRNGAADVRCGVPARASGSGPAEMSLGLVEALSGQEAGQEIGRGAGLSDDGGAGAQIEDAVWRRLCVHAERRLVEGTERSRLAGAGAGVADTD